MSEFLGTKKLNPNNRWRRIGLAIFSAGALALTSCSEVQVPSENRAKIEAADDCRLEIANDNVKGYPACINYSASTRTVNILTESGEIFSVISQECFDGKISYENEVVAEDKPVTVEAYGFRNPESACIDGLQKNDGGALNQYIGDNFLPVEVNSVAARD